MITKNALKQERRASPERRKARAQNPRVPIKQEKPDNALKAPETAGPPIPPTRLLNTGNTKGN